MIYPFGIKVSREVANLTERKNLYTLYMLSKNKYYTTILTGTEL